MNPLSPEARRLLQELLDEQLTTNVVPQEASLRARHHSTPWLVDELLRGDLAVSHASRLSVSLGGLAALGGSAAQAEQARARELYDVLKQAHVNDPGKTWGLEDLAALPLWQGGSRDDIGRLLRLFSPLGIFPTSSSSAEGLITSVTVSPKIFSVDPFAPPPLADEAEDAEVTVTIRYFLGIREATWSPEGVSLLAGPNGAGKSSILLGLSFLSSYFESDLSTAIQRIGGARNLRNIFALDDQPTTLAITHGQVHWELQLAAEGAAINPNPGELLRIGDQVLLRRGLFSTEWYLRTNRHYTNSGDCCLRAALRWDFPEKPLLAGLIRLLKNIRFYPSYNLEGVRRESVTWQGDGYLHPSGKNLYGVLRNWRSAPRQYSESFSWVLHHLKRAFPDVVDNIEFPSNGDGVNGTLYLKGVSDIRSNLALHRASDGILIGLLHLTAVAGMPTGGLIALDEMENQLHPHAIRMLLAAIRQRAEDHGFRVLLTTHSPVVMNEFRDEPEQLFILARDLEKMPLALTEARSEDALLQVQLGELYSRLDFAAPDLSDLSSQAD